MPPMCCLPTVEFPDAPLSSPGSSTVQVPRFPRYYQGAMTSCRPFRRASFPSLGDATPALVFCPHATERCRVRVSWSWSPGISSRGFVSGDDRISYVPGEPREFRGRLIQFVTRTRPMLDSDGNAFLASRILLGNTSMSPAGN